MTKTTFCVLLAASLGCASEVELPIDIDPDAAPGSEEEPDSPPDSPSSEPPLTASDWSWTDSPVRGHVEDLVWTTDGAIVAATPTPDPGSPSGSVTRRLTRYGAEGAIEWVIEGDPTDTFRELAAVDGGGVVVGIWPGADTTPRAPAGLAWYDADGNVTASWRPSAEETGDLLVSISSLRPLPDGGVFWVGHAGIYDSAPVAGLLDAERQLQWMVRLPVFAGWYQSGHPEVAVLADGGLAVMASYEAVEPDWPDGDAPPHPRTHLFELGPDGDERWRTELVGLDRGTGIRGAPSGNLIVAGAFEGRIAVGDLMLEDATYYPRLFVAEIDPSGEARGLHDVELPDWLGDVESRFRLDVMTVAGQDLVLTGPYVRDTPQDVPHVQAGLLATTHRMDGAFVSERIYAHQVAGEGGSVPLVVDGAPDGRLAVGGQFAGSVDFGDGVIDTGVNENGSARGLPFVAVFDPADDDVD